MRPSRAKQHSFTHMIINWELQATEFWIRFVLIFTYILWKFSVTTIRCHSTGMALMDSIVIDHIIKFRNSILKTLSNVKCFILQTIQFISSVIKVWSRFLFFFIIILLLYLVVISVPLDSIFKYNTSRFTHFISSEQHNCEKCNLAYGIRKLLKRF